MPQANERITTPKLPRALPPAARKQVEHAIEAHLAATEALTAFLDVSEPESDLEPSLGSQDPVWTNTDQTFWAGGSCDDLEDQHDGREFNFAETHGRGDNCGNDHDAEPSLAHTNDLNQARAHVLARGWDSASDFEDEHDGREPSLGVPESRTHMQLGWAAGSMSDREDDGDDREPDGEAGNGEAPKGGGLAGN